VISASILAGGLSSRMGREKARLRLGGLTLIGRVRATVKRLELPVRVIRRDLVERCGPMGGVYTALRTSSADAELLLACDMPFVTERLLAALLAHLGEDDTAVFVRHKDRFGFPFVIRRKALATVEELLAKKQLSLQTLAESVKAAWIEAAEADAPALFNINTPAEFRSAQQRIAGQRAIRPRD
jgi:molybdopterin-guanine dinucleotide biosynthesis protein A